jgi:8-oxo-dGTP pyrophosphatase MutT (NUDIX family)
MNEKLFAATTKTFEAGTVYRDYPVRRLTNANAYTDQRGRLVLPDGEWTRNNDTLPTTQETAAFLSQGYEVDSHGRPLHPWVHEMLANPDVGVVTGKGFYYNWGPNYTADPIVLTTEEIPSVLLIQRADTKKWAVPGGFVDPGEANPLSTATRELYEETNLSLQDKATLVYQGAVADPRTTANAWAETSAYSFLVDKPLPVLVRDPKEVEAVQWFPINQLPDELHGSHAVLIEMAVAQMQNSERDDRTRKSIREILNTPNDQLETTIIDAGHMAYDHLFVKDSNDRLFVKAHDASRFSDAFREAHSRAYLQKEHALFSTLAAQGYTAIPERVDLIDDSLLAMDALHPDDGWLWRAPEDGQFDRYVRDVLAALDQLQEMPVPPEPFYHQMINPTYETYWREGWDDITPEKVPALVNKIVELSASWSDARREDALSLIDDLQMLIDQAAHIDRTPAMVMSHNDARQSNIAWHPEHGAKIVDWSWGDPAPRDADSTMFLVDLAKSGYDVRPYVDHLNKDQLLVYVGFLLAHSLWQTRDGSTTVREQQVASASAAHRLLALLGELRRLKPRLAQLQPVINEPKRIQ